MGQIATLAVSTAISLAQARQQARAQNAAAEAAARFQTDQIQRARENRERQRREQLRRALAAQRAQFGARGIGGGGSAAAVLEGLTQETERANADDRGLDELRIGRINNALSDRRRRNLLDASRAQQRLAFGLFRQGLGGISLLD